MITIEKQGLVGPLSKVAGIAAKRSPVPILEQVLIEVEGDTMRITGTDLEVTLVAEVPCKGVSWKGCVSASKFLPAVRAMPADTIKVAVGEERMVTVSAGRSRLRLPTMPAESFPMPERPQARAVQLSSSDLENILSTVRPTMAKNDVRYFLNGALLHADGRTLRAVATDGHRLGYAEMEAAADAEFNLILPHRGVEALIGLLTEEAVGISADEHWFLANAGDFTLLVKQIDGQFPDWKRVVPEPIGKVTVSAAVLRGGLERAAIAAAKDGVRLSIGHNQIALETDGQAGEKLDDSVDAEADIEMVVGANIGYLDEAIKVAGTELVEIGLKNPESAIVVRPVGRSDRFTVVMPMRL